MSRTIDEKVVEMRFDNRDFEKNVSQSMSTLDKLKSALDFSGAEKAFSGITSAANKVDLGGISKAFDGVEKQVSNLEKVIDGFFENIGRRLSNWSIDMVKSVTIDQVTEGWDKYADKTTSVQTIMNATGRTIDDVSEKLDALNWFTDETSYSFTDMTSSIGKFTSQSVELEDAVVAMEGISAAAALAGQQAASASRVMYNFSQALGMGTVKVQDWMSVENAQMATEEFKQTIIDTAIELGRLDMYGNIRETKYALDELGNIQYDELGNILEEAQLMSDNYSGPAFANTKNFRNTLAAGWFDDKVLIAAMKKFGGFSNRLNEVYNQFNENYDVTTSQILTWLDTYMDGTLDINEAVKKTGLTAEEILPVLEELSSEEYDLGRRAFKAAQEAKTFEDVVNATADAVSTAWMNVFEKIFGNYEEARVTWTQLANELWDIFAGPISNLNDLLTDWHDMGGREDFIQSVKNMYHAVRSFLDPIGEAWESVFPPKTADDIYNFTKRLKEFGERLALNDTQMDQVRMVFEDFFGIFKAFSSGFSSFGGGFTGFFKGIGDALRNVGTPIYDFLLGVQRIRSVIEAFENGDLSEFSFVQQTKDAYPAAAKFLETYEKIVDTAFTLGHMLGKLVDLSDFFKDGALSVDSVIDGIKIKFATILGTTSEIIHLWTGKDISKIVDNLRAIFFGLADGIDAFLGSERWSEVKYVISGIAAAFKDTFGPAWQAAVTILDDWINGIRTLIEGADGDFSGFFDTITMGAYHIASFVRSLKGGVEFISDFLVKFLSLTDAINTYRENGGGIVGILAVVHEKLKIILDTVFDIVQNVTGLDLHGVGDGIISVIESIGRAVLQVSDTIAQAFGWKDNPFGKLLGMIDEGFGGLGGNGFDLSGIFDRFGDAFSRLGELVNKVAPGVSILLRTVGDAFKNLWELIGQIRLEDLITIFQGITSIALMFQAKNTLAELGDTLEAYQKKLKADMLFAIAGAILMIAGAAVLISKIDAEKIGLVLGTLGTSFVGLIGVMVASKWADPRALAALPGTVLAIATAMVILAKAAEMMSGPIQAFADMENFWSGMGKLGTVMASFLVLLGILGGINSDGKVLGAAKALGKLAGVLAVMLPIVLVYSKIDWGTFGSGLVKAAGGIAAIGTVLGLLVGFEKRLTEGGYTADFMSMAKALLVLSGALTVLTAVMLVLSKLEGLDYLASLGKILGILAVAAGGVWLFSKALTAFGETMFLLDKTGAMEALNRFSTVLVKLGTAILMLTVGTLGLGLIAKLLGDSAQEIAEAGVNLIVVVLDAIVARTPEIAEDIVLFILGVLDAVADHTPEIVSACIRIIGGIAEGVKDAMENGGIDLGEILGGGGILAGILGITWLLKKAKLGVKDFSNAGLALVGAAALLVEVGALFYGMGQLSEFVGGPAGLEKFAKFGEALTSALMGNNGGVLIMVMSLLAMVGAMSVVIGKLNLNEKDMASSIGKAFLVLGQMFGEVVGLIAELGILFTVFGALSDLIGAPAKIASFGELCSAIVDFFLGVDENGNAHAGVAILIAACAGLLVLFDKLHLSAAGLGAFGSVVAIIAEVAAVIEAMGLIFALGGQINEWIEMIPGVGEGGIVKRIEEFGALITAIADVVGGLVGHLLGSVVGGIAGGAVEETLKGLGDGLAYIGDKAGGFFEIMTNMGPDVLEGCANFGEMAVSLGKATILDAIGTFLGGKEKYKKFADGISELGPGLKKFADSVDGINVSAVEKAGVCGSIITALAKDVPNEGGIISWFTGDNNIATFGANLVEFGKSLMKYSYYVQNVDSDAVDATSSSIETLAAVAKDLPNEGGLISVFTGNNSFATFGENLESFGKSLFTYSAYSVETNKNIGALTSVGRVVKSLGDAASTIDSISSVKDITKFGENIVKFGGKLKEYAGIASEIDVTQVDAVTSAVVNILDAFITDDSEVVTTKIEMIGDKILDGIVTLFGTNDSEKKTKEATEKLITYISDKFVESASVNKISVAITDMVSNAVGKDELKEGLKTSGLNLIKEIQNGIEEAFTGDEGLIKKFEQFLTQLETSIDTGGQTGRAKRFYDAGAALMGALRNGMTNEEAVSGFGMPPAKQLKDEFQAILDSLIGMIVSDEMKGQFQRGGASLINTLLGGIKSVDVVAQMSDVGKNATLGLANGMTDKEAMDKVAQSAKAATTVAISTAKTNLQEKSPSRVTMLIGRFFTEGFANGIYDKIPNAKEAVTNLVQAVKDGVGQNDLIAMANKLGLNLDGALDDHIANMITQHGLDDFLDGDLDSLADSMLSSLQSGEITSGSGLFDQWMTDFQNEYASSVGDMSNMGYGTLDSFTAGAEEYVNNGYVADSATMVTDEMSSVYGDFVNTSGDYGRSGVYNYADNVVSAVEEVRPALVTASESLGDATAAPLEERMAEMLSYAEWVAQKYPEGIEAAYSTPVFDFEDLYESMKGGQLEALLNEFDALDEAGRKNLIRAYGLGEQGGNEDLANYLQWYWKNEPIRIQNEEAIVRAQEGYQAYLEEQKALQEAQTIQSQQQYEGVQQLAADMQTHTDEFNAKYLAVVEEIKMNVAALREELDGVHEDIVQLNDMYVYLDGDTLVGATAGRMDEKLGNNSVMAGRRVTR